MNKLVYTRRHTGLKANHLGVYCIRCESEEQYEAELAKDDVFATIGECDEKKDEAPKKKRKKKTKKKVA
jgi:hypothetical protein